MLVIDTVAMAWETLANGLAIKRLRTDPATGGSSAILRAPPRPRGASQPHHHPSDETILNLGAPMRFEPGPWIGRFGYSHYPAGVTHGFDVDLPDGYEVFVRTSGWGEAIFPEAVTTRSIEASDFIRICDPDEQPWVSPAELADAKGAMLKVFQRSGAVVTGLLALEPGGRWSGKDAQGAIELLVLEGALTTGVGTLRPGGYLEGRGGDDLVSPGGALIFLRLS